MFNLNFITIMSSNFVKLGINYRKNMNTKSAAYGKYYAVLDTQETLTTAGLAAHIKEHNFGYGIDAIKAVLQRLSECIPELLAQGIPVKLDGLGTFMPTVQNGVMNVDGVPVNGLTEAQLKDSKVQPTGLVAGVHIRFRPDGAELQNLTSRQFLAQKVSLESRYVLDGTKVAKSLVATPLETFRAPVDPGD